MATGKKNNVTDKTRCLFLCVLLLASMIALGTAYIAQYGFGLEPCRLCLYQRFPYMGIILVALVALFIPSSFFRDLALIGCAFLFSIEVGIAFFHVGVEQGIITIDIGCSDQKDGAKINSIEELRAQLLQTEAVPCDKPAAVVFGLSMAAWNGIFSLLLASMTWYRVIYCRKRHKKRTDHF